MKEMQKAMKDLSPEDKKMMDSMGIKIPSIKALPNFSDQQLAAAWDAETSLVPAKNLAAIAAIPSTPATTAIPGFISTIHKAVITKMNAADKTEADNIYMQLKQQPGMNAGNAAIG